MSIEDDVRRAMTRYLPNAIPNKADPVSGSYLPRHLQASQILGPVSTPPGELSTAITERHIQHDPMGLELVPVTLPGLGSTYLNSRMVGPVNNFVANAAASGTDIKFSSAFRTTNNQSKLNESNSTTPAAPGSSLHEAGYAVDINWREIPADQRQNVVDAAVNAGLSWGGNFRRPDPVHFFSNPTGSRENAIQDAQRKYRCLLGDTSAC
jgi:hypothetical protein